MFTVRKSSERGHFDHGWLNTYHTFSFGRYYDPAHESFRSLRVINEDYVQPGHGFPAHPHDNMEIVTYVLSGELEHRDSMGNGTVIRPGDVQRMSAGTGITHSEFNPSPTAPVHLLQIWMYPERKGLTPSYEQKHFSDDQKRGRLALVGSPDGREGSVVIHQDVALYAAALDRGAEVVHHGQRGRHAWLQVVSGDVAVNDVNLEAGDGASISDAGDLNIRGLEPAELLLFDLA